MEDLFFNLAKEEFSKSRKILIWVLAIGAGIVTIWDTYLNIVKHNTYTATGLTITLYFVTSFLFFIAFLATKKRKEHFFKVDNQEISYHYGLLFPSHHKYLWQDIIKIYVPPNSKNLTLKRKDGAAIHINLTWIEKNKSRLIRRHIFYAAKARGIDIAKKAYKK